MNKRQIKISDFSPHLFWDVNKKELDFEKHKKYIINRTLDYGLLNDWILINNLYGLPKITEIAITIRDLDKKSIAFISALSNIPKTEFLCYTSKQSNPKHWDF